MNKAKSTMCALAVCLFIFTCVSVAQAVPRTFVSGSGNDANTASNCSFTNPCRFLLAAYGVTDAGGEIIALTTAGYGGLTITKAITIQALPGQVGLINVVTGSSGLIIDTAAAVDNVVIRNFQFNGTPSGATNSTGVTHNNGVLLLDGCKFMSLTTGLSVVPDTGTGVLIRESTFRGNTTGVNVTGGRVVISDCQFSLNSTGIRADGDGGANLNPANGPTMVFLEGGDIVFNTTGLRMHNPGLKPVSGINNGANIYVRHNNSVPTTNIINNTSALVVTGNASQCGADPCVSPNPGKYTTQLNIVQVLPHLFTTTDLAFSCE